MVIWLVWNFGRAFWDKKVLSKKLELAVEACKAADSTFSTAAADEHTVLARTPPAGVSNKVVPLMMGDADALERGVWTKADTAGERKGHEEFSINQSTGVSGQEPNLSATAESAGGLQSMLGELDEKCSSDGEAAPYEPEHGGPVNHKCTAPMAQVKEHWGVTAMVEEKPCAPMTGLAEAASDGDNAGMVAKFRRQSINALNTLLFGNIQDMPPQREAKGTHSAKKSKVEEKKVKGEKKKFKGGKKKSKGGKKKKAQSVQHKEKKSKSVHMGSTRNKAQSALEEKPIPTARGDSVAPEGDRKHRDGRSKHRSNDPHSKSRDRVKNRMNTHK
jgi:hypothetical protein